MLSKPKIKLINSLKQRKFRKQHGLFVAEGTTNVIDFIKGGVEIDALFATGNWIKSYKNEIPDHSITEIDKKELKKISLLKNPSEVVCVFRIPEFDPIDINNISDIVLMLDDIRDPGNLGTIIRTADWFGIKDIICSEESVDAFNPKVVQASMGSLSRVKVHFTNLKIFLKSKPDYLKVFGTVLDGENIIEIPKPKKGIILIGNEAHGISEELIPLVDQRITIPLVESSITGPAESLNASIATAIVCYEFRR